MPIPVASDMSMTNGHTSESPCDDPKPLPLPTQAESDLSDARDVPTAQVHDEEDEQSDEDAMHDMATSEMDEDEDEDAPGEDDADYDAESPPPEQAGEVSHDRSTSEESARPGKRKSDDVDDEEYMKENPELYGLRRSVSALEDYCHCGCHVLTRFFRAGHDLRVEWYVHSLYHPPSHRLTHLLDG